MAEQLGTPMKTRESLPYTAAYRFVFRGPSLTTKTNLTLFHRFPLLGVRKREWLIKIRRDEDPQFKWGTESVAEEGGGE